MSKFSETSIPQIWGKNPIFAAVKQENTTVVKLSDGAVWKMGVQPPFGKITNPDYLKGFDVRHAEVIFKLLAFYRENDIDFSHKVDISYYKLLQIIGWKRCSKNLKTLKEILADLNNIWTQIIVNDDHYIKFQILSAEETGYLHNSKENPKLRYIQFAPTFLEFLGDIEKFFSIRLDIFNSLSSGIAKAIYLYIPSRALKSTKKRPFRITLTNLYRQINIKVPVYKSDRLRKITQHKRPIIAQLDHALINYNKKLRVTLEKAKDNGDYNFCAWVEELSEKDLTVPGKDSLRSWFINGQKHIGDSSPKFDELIKNIEPLDWYQIETLKEAEIDWEKSRVFLEQSKALLGRTKFDELCSDVKSRVLSSIYSDSVTPLKSPIAYLIALIRSELLGELPLY
jgi:hypothetical protein